MLVTIAVPVVVHASVDTAWVRRYDGPAHGGDWATRIAVDTAGNVYVTGASSSDTSSSAQYLDFVTIKYYPNGDTAWVRRMDFGGKDIPSGLGVDAQGNVYVTGTNNDSRMVTVKYDSAGHQKWVKLYGSQALCDDLVLDQEGNVIICGGDVRTSTDCVIIKYRPNGDTAWARFYDWAGYDDDLYALAPVLQGDICAVGFCSDTVPGGNILTLMYDSIGDRRWAAVYDGPQHGTDWPSAVAVDGMGNSYVAGVSDHGYGTSLDYLTIKYDSAGETLWTRRFDGAANGDDRAQALAADGAGNVIVTGTAQFEAGNRDFATVKYDRAGAQMWVARYDGPAGALDEAHSMAIDELGNAYVTGSTRIQQNVAGCVTIKYDANGDTGWVATLPAPPLTPVNGEAIVVGTDDCVYVAGVYDGDILTIKYIQSGGVAEERYAPIPPLHSLMVEPTVFRSETFVRFCTGIAASARVLVFDAEGRCVRTLANGCVGASVRATTWEGRNDRGTRLPPGVYIVVLEAGGRRAKVKIVMSV